MRKKLFLGIIMVSTTMLLFACKANHSEEEDKTASKQTDHNEKNETKKDIKKMLLMLKSFVFKMARTRYMESFMYQWKKESIR